MPSVTPTIQRMSQSEQLRVTLRSEILAGRIEPGMRLVEARLAEEWGVGRTPLREALLRLTGEGFVELEANRGFSVVPLTQREAAELYPILGVLEAFALRLTPPADATRLDVLAGINHELASCVDDVERAVELNLRWHETLLEWCPNDTLLTEIAALRARIVRYEFSYYAPGSRRIADSCALHASILEALAAGDLEVAAERLDRQWHADLDSIADRIE